MSRVEFNELVNHPEHWFRVASQLLNTAELTLSTLSNMCDHPTLDPDQSVGTFRSSGLLLAFAMENALKGLAVHKGEQHVVQNNSLKWSKKSFKQHQLDKMARDLEVTLNADEESLLARLMTFGRWAGRYHTPNSQTDYTLEYPKQKFTDSKLSRHLIERLKEEAGYHPTRGWPFRHIQME